MLLASTCNICLGYRESWAKKNKEKVRVMNKNCWDEHRESICWGGGGGKVGLTDLTHRSFHRRNVGLGGL